MNCSQCVNPKVCYISAGKTVCTCGGTVTFDPPLVSTDYRGKLHVPTLGDKKEPPPDHRKRTLLRFTQVLGGGMFNCAHCYLTRDAKQMMRFADEEALAKTPLTDWCGVCVKKAVAEVAFDRAEMKKLWRQIREGIKPTHEAILGSADRDKKLLDRTREDRARTAAKPRVRLKAPEGPPPEITLIL